MLCNGISDDPPDIGQIPEEIPSICRKDPFYKNLVTFRRLGPKTILECLSEVCNIVKEGLIIDMEYPMVFLEFYDVFIMCALKIVDKKLAKRADLMEKTNSLNDPSLSINKLNVETSKTNAKRNTKSDHRKGKSK